MSNVRKQELRATESLKHERNLGSVRLTKTPGRLEVLRTDVTSSGKLQILLSLGMNAMLLKTIALSLG